MSKEQKDNISFWLTNTLKLVLTLCGALLSILYFNMRSDMSEFKQEVKTELKLQGDDINKIKVDVAIVKTYVKYYDK